jgi:hypothetical protein
MDIFYPLQYLSDNLISFLGLSLDSRLGSVLGFFVYDSLKIIILLLAINYLMAFIRHYLPIKKLQRILNSRRWYGADYFLAATFGTITPFCSCSSIPLFVGFINAGIPLGVTFSFLISSPLVNEAAIAIFIGLFGWKITILYILSAVLLGVASGLILNSLKLEKYISKELGGNKETGIASESKPLKSSFKKFWKESLSLTRSLTPYVLAGVAIGATIHGLVPVGFFEKRLIADSWLSIPIATVLGLPIYANAVGVLPIMQSLMEKGISLGTVMAFMMAVVGLSLPEALILRKVMKPKLLFYFFGITAINIMIIGYLFNLVG